MALKRLGNKTVEEKSDELSEMINRASKYLSIVQIRIMATVLCISFKGEGVKNILDLHEFRLNLPEIEYENKTWSNMDLVLHLKRDVTKILLNHTGGLIGNKLKKHRKKKTTQKLNQLTNYVAFTPVANLAYDPSSVSNYADSVVSNENVQEEDDDEFLADWNALKPSYPLRATTATVAIAFSGRPKRRHPLSLLLRVLTAAKRNSSSNVYFNSAKRTHSF